MYLNMAIIVYNLHALYHRVGFACRSAAFQPGLVKCSVQFSLFTCSYIEDTGSFTITEL